MGGPILIIYKNCHIIWRVFEQKFLGKNKQSSAVKLLTVLPSSLHTFLQVEEKPINSCKIERLPYWNIP